MTVKRAAVLTVVLLILLLINYAVSAFRPVTCPEGQFYDDGMCREIDFSIFDDEWQGLGSGGLPGWLVDENSPGLREGNSPIDSPARRTNER